MKSVTIDGFKSHLYKEGFGYNVFYQNINSVRVKRSLNRIKRQTSGYRINLVFNPIYSVDNTLNDQKYSDVIENNKSSSLTPFFERKLTFKKIGKNTTIFHKNYGDYSNNIMDHQKDFQEYKDINFFSVKDLVTRSESDILKLHYPLEFNVDNYHQKGGRIDVFDLVNKIKMYSFGVDKIKGVKAYITSNGLNTNKKSLKIEDHFVRKHNKNDFFEDGIIKDVIYNKNSKKIIDQIYKFYEEEDDEIKIKVEYRAVTRVSNEPRYINQEKNRIKPFTDMSYNQNDIEIKNNDFFNINKLSSNSLNDILLSNRDKYNYMDERNIYLSRGRSIDYSSSNGLDSIAFYESLD